MSALRPGAEVDQYRVMRLLGRGGMGEVYLARDSRLGRRVALKVIRPERLRSRRAIVRFFREARTTAKFNHPHIVAIYGVGEHRGVPYVALEYLEGQSLSERLDEEPLPAAEAMRIGLAVAEALAEAHRHGVLHRDLKPANVILGRDGRARVVDFGLAASIGDEDDGVDGAAIAIERTTEPASIEAGTPMYMAPEQWRRERGSDRTDVWALGLILFEMATGWLPYEPARGETVPEPADPASWPGDTALPPPAGEDEHLERLRTAVTSPDPVPGLDTAPIPVDLARVIGRCLSKVAAERPSAAEVAASLRGMIHAGAERPLGTGPFRGLLPFTEEHAALFFGREGELDAFLERMRHVPVLPVVGPSGVGKSSFVQAGVIPRLREQGNWHVLRLRPGPRPLEALTTQLLADRGSATVSGARDSGLPRPRDSALPHDVPLPRESMASIDLGEAPVQALAERILREPQALSLELRALADRQGARVLLFVDQLEELFTLERDDDAVAAFVEAVCTAADDPSDPIRVIFTVRDDFLARLAVGPAARDALMHVTMVQPLGRAELRAALEKPVQAFGYAFEDEAIVERMVDAAGAEPASLPLLQFAAQKLWEERDERRCLLLRSAHDAMGGVEGALARHADGVLESLEESELAVARELTLRLVTPDRTRRVITRRAALEGLGDEAEPVLARLIAARLVVARKARRDMGERTRLELAHESLIRSWASLARWLDESKEDLAFLSEAEQAAELWQRRGRRAEELWQGDALREAERMLARSTAEPPEVVQGFLRASRERDARQRRLRRAAILSVVAVLAVVAAGASIAAVVIANKEREAREQRDRAEATSREAQRRHAEALREAAGAALHEGRLLEARAKLRMALEIEDSQPARALWWRLASDPLVWQKPLGALVYDVTVAPDGGTVAAACQDHSIYLLDARTLALRVLRGHRDQVQAVTYSADGARLASGSWDGSIHLWDASSGALLHRIDAHRGGVRSVRFLSGDRLVSVGDDDHLRFWQLAGAAPPKAGPARAIEGCGVKRLDAAAGRLAVSCEQGSILLLDERGKRLEVLAGHGAAVRGVAFSRDGERLASAGADATVRIWSIPEGRELKVLRGHRTGVMAVAWAPGDRALASAGSDRAVRLWDPASGRLQRIHLGHRAMISSVAFAPDGERLVSAGRDGSVRLWDAARGIDGRAPGSHRDSVYGVDFSPDGKLVATASRDGSVRLWNAASGAEERHLEGPPEGLRQVRFSPDGKLVATSGYDQRVRIWQLDDGLEPRLLAGHRDAIYGLAFSPRGDALLTGSYDRELRLFALPSGRSLGVLSGHRGGIRDVAFSPDGLLAGSAAVDGTVRLWDVPRRSEQRIVGRHEGGAHALDFSPDGRSLVSGGVDGQLELWSLGGPSRERIVGRHEGRIYSVRFSPDGQRLASAGSDGTVRLWTLDAGDPLVLHGHRGEVNVVAFSPDGGRVASGSDDHTLRMWRAEDGRPVWRAPLMLSDPPRLFTHLGWVALDRDGRKAPKRSAWSAAVEERAALASASGDALCVYGHDGALELWSRANDERLARAPVPRATAAAATPSSCAAIAEDRAWLLSSAGLRALDMERASAINAEGERLFVAGASGVAVYDAEGRRQSAREAGPGVTALAPAGDKLAMGHTDGKVELVVMDGSPAAIVFERTPSSPAVRMLAGPADTLAVGFADGTLGLWNASDGAQLADAQLHGPVIHLLVEGRKLYAATDLGRHLVWDLSALFGSWCELLASVWKRVPVVWRDGHALVETPPVHECRR